MADYTSLFAEDDARRAAESVQGAYGIGAPAAIQAISDAPDTGVDPTLGMTNPAPQAELAQQDRNSRLLASTPSLQKFAAQSPAHVAATQSGWPQMKRLSDFFDWYAENLKGLHEAVGVQATPENPGTFGSLYALHRAYLGAVSNLPQTVVGNPAARWNPFADPQLREATPQEKADTLTQIAINALAVGTGRTVKGPTIDLGPATEVFPQPRLRGPGGAPEPAPVIDAEFEPLKPPGVNPTQNEFYAQQAAADAQVAQRAAEMVNEIPSNAQVPQLTEQFIEGTVAGGQQVWVDPQAILRAYSEGHQPFQPMAQEIGDALNSGREVQMPLSTYLSEVAGKPYEEAIRNATRFREDGISVDQAKEMESPASAGGEPVRVEGSTGGGEAGGGVVGGAPQRELKLPEDIGPEHYATSHEVQMTADNAVEEVFRELSIEKLFDEGKTLKLSKSRFERYDNMLAEAKAAASERILNRHYNQIRKERTPEWKDMVARERYAAEQALAGNRVIGAMMELQYGQGPLGEPLERPSLKLHRPSVKEEYGQATVEGLPRGMFGSEGVSADEAAQVLGYPSGQELLSDLLDLEAQRTQGGYESSKALVKGMLDREAEAAARRKLGYDISPEGIMAAAHEEAVLPKVEDFLIEELRVLGEEAGFPLNVDDLKYEASRQFDQLPVREAKNVRTFERGMWRTGERAMKAMEKGDVVSAFLARQQQLLNFYQLEAAHFLSKKWAQGEKKFRRLAKKATIRGLAQPFLNHLHSYLPRFGFTVNREPQELAEALGGVSLQEFVDDIIATDAAFPNVPSVAPRPMDQLRVADYWRVRAFILAMDKYGRELQKARKEDKTAEFEAVVEEALAAAPPGKPPRKLRADRTQSLPEKVRSGFLRYDAMHRKAADMVEVFDGGNVLGIWHDNIIRPMYKGADKEAVLRQEMYEPVAQAWDAVPDEVKRQYNKVVPSPFVVGSRPLEVRRKNVLVAALYAGTVEGREKAARGFGVEPDALVAWVNAHITPEEVGLVEKVWERFEALAPTVSEELRALTGQGLRRVEASPVVLGGRKLRGGYWPITYNRDPQMNPQVVKWEQEREAKLSPDGVDQLFGDLLPNKGFSEERTDYIGAVDLELALISSAFNSHIKYAAYARAVSAVRKFVYHPLIAARIETVMGPEYMDVIPSWLDGVVKPYQASERLLAPLDRFFGWLGRRVTIGTLVANWGTLIAQAAGVTNAMAVLSDGQPLEGFARLMGGYGKLMSAASDTHVVEGEVVAEGIHAMFARSEFMRHRYGELEQNMTEALMDASALDPGHVGVVRALKHFERLGFQAIGWMEFVTVSAPQWYAAEQKALEQGMTPERAVEYADRLVIKAQGAARRVDLSAVQRIQGLGKLLYAFQSYFNQAYQLGVDVYRNLAFGGGGGQPPEPPQPLPVGEDGEPIGGDTPEERRNRYNFAKAFSLALMVWVLSNVLDNLLRGKHNKITDPLMSFLRPMFLVNSFASAADKAMQVKNGKLTVKTTDLSFGDDLLTQTGTAWVQFAAMLGQAVKGKKMHRPIQTTAAALRPVVPGASQIGKTGEYLHELTTGEQKPKNWIDLYWGLTSGPRQDQAHSTRLRY